MPTPIQSVSTYSFSQALSALSHSPSDVASSVALRSDTRDKYGAIVGVNPYAGADGQVSLQEMNDLFQLTKTGGQGLSSAELKVARLAGVYAKALAPQTAAMPTVAFGKALDKSAEPNWRKEIRLSAITGTVDGIPGNSRYTVSAREIAQRIAGPSATKITAADFAKAMPRLTQVEKISARALFNKLFFSKPFVLGPEASVTPKGRPLTLETTLTPTADFPVVSHDSYAPAYNLVAKRTLSMPVEAGVAGVNLATGEVIEAVDGKLTIPVPADGKLALALMRTTGYRRVLERFDFQTQGSFSMRALV